MTSGTRTESGRGPTIKAVMGSNGVLMLAGLLVWLIAGARVLVTLAGSSATPRALVDLVAWLLFLAAFLLHVWFDAGRRTRKLRVAALALQSACAMVLAQSAGGTGMEIALLVMVAGQLPGCVTLTESIAWAVAQTAALLIVQITGGASPSWMGGTMFFGSYLSFQFFAIGAASLAESEREARQALSAAHLQLERMHGVAVESARHAERLRIARDLHDSLGHRLTALGLTLEAARHLPPDEVPPKVGEARALASALMDDLRRSVGDIRDDESPELRSLLDGLARSVLSPRVTVDVVDSVRITSPEATTALFRIGQEIVTNAARHAGATELRLTLRASGDEAVFEGTDNGTATDVSEPGNGLTGIGERAQLLGGRAEFAPAQGGGFRVRVFVPLARLT